MFPALPAASLMVYDDYGDDYGGIVKPPLAAKPIGNFGLVYKIWRSGDERTKSADLTLTFLDSFAGKLS